MALGEPWCAESPELGASAEAPVLSASEEQRFLDRGGMWDGCSSAAPGWAVLEECGSHRCRTALPVPKLGSGGSREGLKVTCGV